MAAPQTPEEQLRERATVIATAEIEPLIHPVNAGSFNFELVRDLIETIQRFYSEVASAQFKHLSSNLIVSFNQAAERQQNAFTQLRDFNYTSNDPNTVSRHITENLRQTWDSSYNIFAPHLWFARSSSSAIASELQSLRGSVSTMQGQWATAAQDLVKQALTAERQTKDGIAELKRAVSAAREAAQIEGVAAQATAFDKEARSALVASRIWLGVTIVGIIAGIIVVYCLFLNDVRTSERAANTSARPGQSATNTVAPPDAVESKVITATLLQQTIARILIITLVYTAVVWCGRNYFASRHNYTVNRHRANAMQTFQAFANGSADSATRDFILRQAAQCAFSPQQSGYLKDESLPTPGPASQILDLAKPGSD
jgi:hypothetical protein